MAKKLSLDKLYEQVGSFDTGGTSVYEDIGFSYIDDAAKASLIEERKTGRFGDTTKIIAKNGTKSLAVDADIRLKEPVGVVTRQVRTSQVLEIDGKKTIMTLGRIKLVFGNCPTGCKEMSDDLKTEVDALSTTVKGIKEAHAGENGYVGGTMLKPAWIAL